MINYKLYAFVGESIKITEYEIDEKDLLEYLNYKIGAKCIFSPYDEYKHAGQKCQIIDYVNYFDGADDGDDWCYNVIFADGHTQRIYEGELELITVN